MKSLLVLLTLLTAACRPPSTSKPEVTIAAAANLTRAFEQMGPRFEAATGIHPVFSFGSTAQLARQIENSAPFDLFAAADAQHVAELDRKGLLLAGSRAVYAIGVLAVWIPSPNKAAVTWLEDLASPSVHVIAMAKPELAPYGQAAVETLHHLGIWDAVEPKIVYAENINMARQYGLSNNADAVFTARSLILNETGRVILVDERLHQPIIQELGIVAKSTHLNGARRFADFLLRGDGKQMLTQSGYRTP